MITLDLSSVNQKIWDEFCFYCKQGSRFELVSVIPIGFTSPIYLRRSTSDINNFIQIYLHKEYNFLPEQPQSILDLGGYIGLSSTYLSHEYPNAKIVLVEPDPDNYTIARLNTRQFTNIECVNCGVWSKKCDLTISNKGGDWGTMVREVLEDEEVSPRIRSMSIIDLMDIFKMNHIDFLKIDIEGSEKEIFSHYRSEEWIKKCKVVSCELHDRMIEGCSSAFHNAMNKEGFIHGKNGEFDYYIKNSG